MEMAELPSAGMALNEIGQALEKQINALENLPSGENTSPSKFMENQGTNQDESKTDPFENSSPFSDPEVSEVLAQTLDALDQAIFGAENSFLETSLKPSLETLGSSGSSGEERADPISPPKSKTQKKLSMTKSKEVMVPVGPVSFPPILWLLNRLASPPNGNGIPCNPCPKSPRF